MVGSNGTMIAIRLVRSKLRKREEHHHRHSSGNAVHPEQVQCATVGTPSACRRQQQQQQQHHHQQQQQQREGIVNPVMSNSTTTVDSCCAGATTHSAGSTLVAALGNGCAAANQLECTSPDTASTMVYTTGNASAEQFIWQFPPPYPSPNTPPPQYTLYNDQDTLVHGLQSDRQGFAKGFRKNLGGRWRRLVKRKPESEQCAIPPELKDQLKTIYVY